jgi:hypothetical protein
VRHPSTPAERLVWIGRLLADEGVYGVVTAISRASGASRPTLYAWRERARQALTALWAPPADAGPSLEIAVLTLLLEAHASTRGMAQGAPHLSARPAGVAPEPGHDRRGHP